jgi:hypothetical protein
VRRRSPWPLARIDEDLDPTTMPYSDYRDMLTDRSQSSSFNQARTRASEKPPRRIANRGSDILLLSWDPGLEGSLSAPKSAHLKHTPKRNQAEKLA